MKKWTVVGYYQDNGEVWVRWVTAKDWKSAIQRAVKQTLKSNEGMDMLNIIICSVFKGHQRDYNENDNVCDASEFVEEKKS